MAGPEALRHPGKRQRQQRQQRLIRGSTLWTYKLREVSRENARCCSSALHTAGPYGTDQ